MNNRLINSCALPQAIVEELSGKEATEIIGGGVNITNAVAGLIANGPTIATLLYGQLTNNKLIEILDIPPIK